MSNVLNPCPQPPALKRLSGPFRFAGAAIFVLGAALMFRAQIAEFLIAEALRGAGMGGVSLTVSRLGATGLTIRDLTAEGGALRVSEIAASYSLRDIFRSRLGALNIGTTEATLTWDENGFKLGQFPLQRDPDAPLYIPYVGQLRAADVTFLVNTPAINLRAPLSVTANAVAGGWDASATGTLSGRGVDVTFEWNGLIAPTDLSRSSGQGRFDIFVDDFPIPGTAGRLDARGAVTFSAADSAFAVSIAEPLTFASTPDRGTSRPSSLIAPPDLPWSVTLAPSPSEASLVFAASGENRSVRLDVAATGEIGDGRLNLAVVGEAARAPARTSFQLTRAHTDISNLPVAGGTASGHFTISDFSGDTTKADGKVDAAMSLTGVALSEVALGQANASLTGKAQIADGVARFDFSDLRIRVAQLALAGWRLAAPAEVALARRTKSSQSIAFTSPGSGTTADLALALPELVLQSDQDEKARIVLRTPDLRFATFARGTTIAAGIEASGIEIVHPMVGVRDGRFGIETKGGDVSGTASARIERIGTATQNWRPEGALVANATLTTRGDDLALRGRFSTSAGAALGTYAARFSPDLRKGYATISIPRTIFEREGPLRAADLAFIAPISDLSGTVALEARRIWNGARTTESANIALKNLSFSVGEASVAGLTTEINLAGFWPLRSSKPSQLQVKAITAELPLSGLTAAYVLPGDGTLVVTEAMAGAAGGDLTLSNAAIPIDGRAGTFAVGVHKIDIGQLVAQAKVDGLSVTGTLTGTIPLRADETGLRFADGVLQADAPGRLAYAPSSQSSALSQNPGGALLLKALANFAFDRLSITLNGPIMDEVSILAAVAGRNPDLYDGHPIEFNLNLSGRLTEILRQVLVGASIPTDLERQLREGPRPGQ